MGGIEQTGGGDSLPGDARVLLLGRQGAGKSLQGRLLAERLDADFFSVGELLRAEQRSGTPLGVEIGLLIGAGKAVPPDTSYGLLRAKMNERDQDRAVIIDGIPRVLDQVGRVRAVLGGEPTRVVLLEIPTVIAVARLQSRLTCMKCDWPHGPGWPSHDGHCTYCDGALEPRADDANDAIGLRHAFWGAEGAEVVDYYERLGVVHRVRADQAVWTVERSIVAVLVHP